MLKIIGGQFRNRPLQTPKGMTTRPTSGLVRKAVFDISSQLVEGAKFLDLFAGSGAMGIEAISRGAASAVFVEANRMAYQCIKANLDKLGIPPAQALVLFGDTKRHLAVLAAKRQPFDLIYIDPPYEKGLSIDTLRLIDQAQLLAAGGKLFIEESTSAIDDVAELTTEHLRYLTTRKYGNSSLREYTAGN